MEGQKKKHGPELCDQITSEIDAALAENESQMALFGLARFVVQEIPRQPIENDGHDPFIDDLQGGLFDEV